jgi:hypothetical protein
MECDWPEMKMRAGQSTLNNPDPDNDGLNDGVEVYIFETDPTMSDTDGNEMQDGDKSFSVC